MTTAESQTKTTATAQTRMVRCKVVSDKMNKSRVAVIERFVKHPMLGKTMRRRTKLMFHDEKNTTRVGDEVVVRQTRPLSSRKKFELVDVVRQAAQ